MMSFRADRVRARATSAVLAVLALMVALFASAGIAGAATTAYTYSVVDPVADVIKTAGATDGNLNQPTDLNQPTVTIADSINNILYVLDSGNNRIVWYNLATRAHGGTFSMPPELGRFNNPRGMALQPGLGSAARLFVSDTANNRIVVLQPNGSTFDVKFRLTTSISNPRQMVWSAAANRLYVLNRLPGGTASEVRIYRSNTNAGTPANNQLMYVSSFTGTAAGGLSANANGINVLSDNSLAVADTGKNRIVRFGIDGTYVNQFGSYNAQEPIATRDGFLSAPMGVVSRPDGYVPVIDTANHRVQVFTNFSGGDVVAEFGDPRVAGTPDDNTRLKSPEYATALSATQSLVSDTGNNRLLFLTVTPLVDPRTPTNFDGVGCTDCHSVDTRIEHEYRTRRQCLTCHEYSFHTNQIDFTMLKPKINADLLLAGKDDMGTCGDNTIVCHAAGATSDAGENVATHSMDGTQIQAAHRPANVNGTFAATNPCSGDPGGCHSDGSTESPFWFAASDPASAKLDYWTALKSGTASATAVLTGPTDMVGTVDISGIDPPCLVCHDVRDGVNDQSFGETQKSAAIAAGKPWTCTTDGCHDDSGASGVYVDVYADSKCFRTPNYNRIAEKGRVTGASMVPEAPVDEPVGVSAYIQSLVDMVFDGGEDTSADVTILADPLDLPESATPATRPVELDLLLCPVF